MDLGQDLLLCTQHVAGSKLASRVEWFNSPGLVGLGRSDRNTTMLYTHVLKRGPMAVISPANLL